MVGRSEAARARSALLHSTILDLDSIARAPRSGRHFTCGASTRCGTVRYASGASAPRDLPAREAPLLYLQSTGTTGPARVIELSEAALVRAVRIVQGEASHPVSAVSFVPSHGSHLRAIPHPLRLDRGGRAHLVRRWPLHASRTTCERAVRRSFLHLRYFSPPCERRRSRPLPRPAWAALSCRPFRKRPTQLLASGVVGGARRTLGNWLFGRQLRRQAGLDRVEDAFAGTAPLSAPLHAWFEAAGIPLRVVYGQTELAGATAMTGPPRCDVRRGGHPRAWCRGTVLRRRRDARALRFCLHPLCRRREGNRAPRSKAVGFAPAIARRFYRPAKSSCWGGCRRSSLRRTAPWSILRASPITCDIAWATWTSCSRAPCLTPACICTPPCMRPALVSHVSRAQPIRVGITWPSSSKKPTHIMS